MILDFVILIFGLEILGKNLWVILKVLRRYFLWKVNSCWIIFFKRNIEMFYFVFILKIYFGSFYKYVFFRNLFFVVFKFFVSLILNESIFYR